MERFSDDPTIPGDLSPTPDGEWVRYSDVERVQQELERRAEEFTQKMEGEIPEHRHAFYDGHVLAFRAAAKLLSQPNPDQQLESRNDADPCRADRDTGTVEPDRDRRPGASGDGISGSHAGPDSEQAEGPDDGPGRSDPPSSGLAGQVAPASTQPPFSDCADCDCNEFAGSRTCPKHPNGPPFSTQPSSNPGEGAPDA